MGIGTLDPKPKAESWLGEENEAVLRADSWDMSKCFEIHGLVNLGLNSRMQSVGFVSWF